MATARDLPDDVLADVLRRLAPRGLAASRCVCKAWRDAIDARRLLRADLLPRSVGGVFMQYIGLGHPEYLSRPSAAVAGGGAPISGSLDFMPSGSVRRVLSHCNGLLLCQRHDGMHVVANPATRRFAPLPAGPPPSLGEAFGLAACLVYDPATSPHYEVFVIPLVPDEQEQSEWPPLSYTAQVFSSAARRWREASFARVGVVADLKPSTSWSVPNHTAYWRGALYTHCRGDAFITVVNV